MIRTSQSPRFFFTGAQRRRGSTMLIVLGLLSILVLLAASFTLTTRVETLSAFNFERAVKERTLELSGLKMGMMKLSDSAPKGAIGPLDLEELADSEGLRNLYGSLADTNLSDIRVEDASGRLNVNTASEEQLTALFTAIAQMHGAALDARSIASRIVAVRQGRDQAPGRVNRDDNLSEPESLGAEESAGLLTLDSSAEAPNRLGRLSDSCLGASQDSLKTLETLESGVDEESEYVSDIRRPAFGDDLRFRVLEDLLLIDGFSEGLLEASRPYLTTFSVAAPPELLSSRSGSEIEMVDINRATVEEIYEALLMAYGDQKDERLLRQFAANIADARDEDMIPTVLEGPDSPVFGLERVPFITEVYANSRSLSSSDWGEYVEIFNPWPDSISVDGWSISINGTEFPLNGSIPSGGYIIITDNYDDEIIDDDGGAGLTSFYDVHGVVPAGSHKQMLEFRDFNLPHRAGVRNIVELARYGEPVDQFPYLFEQDFDTLKSFQRAGGGVVREVFVLAVSPYLIDKSKESPLAAEQPIVGPRDGKFATPLDLFEVFAGYAKADGSEGVRWAFPQLATPNSPDEETRGLALNPRLVDARLIDLFTIESEYLPGVEERNERMESGLSGDPSLWRDATASGKLDLVSVNGISEPDPRQLSALVWDRYAVAARGERFGRINVNTASAPVLAGAGFDSDQVETILRRREALLQAANAGFNTNGAVYQRVSDILGDDSLWGNRSDCDRLREFSELFAAVTVTSQAFLLEGQARSQEAEMQAGQTKLKVKALVALDRPRPELVDWTFSYD